MATRTHGLFRSRLLIPAIGLVTGLGLAVWLTTGSGPVRVVNAGATVGCSVSYSVSSQWNTGFTAALTVTNVGSPVTNWSLTYSYSGSQQLAQGWSGNWSQHGQAVTVTNATWNGS